MEGMVTAALAAYVLAPVHAPGWACAGTCAHGSFLASHAATSGQSAIVQENRPDKPKMNLLVFSRTAGFRHDSIETGVKALMKMGTENGWAVDWTEDPFQFTDGALTKYKGVIFLNTTGDVLSDSQQAAFERFIEKGGGFIGLHAAADTEYGWPWYGRLVGAYFKSHPHIQQATIQVLNRTHPSTAHLGATWTRTDEWYDYHAVPAPTVSILLKLDTTTYTGHKMGGDHPIAWCHEVASGRAWYTGGGHTKESFAEPDFLTHVMGGIIWACRAK
jgi:type 1 glutamine amidotransferase